MALTIHDQELNTVKEEKKQLELDNSRLRQIGLMIASQREADMDGRTYQDKTTYPKETKGQKLEKSGQYLKDPETEVDTSQPLKSKSFEIDPNKKPLTESQKRLQDKLRDRANTGQQGADLAREKLKKKGGSATDLPNFLKTVIDSRPNPADQLKIILQLLPALTGGGLGQMAGPNYRRDTQIYGERDRILNPDGKFNKPTLDMLREHASRYRV